MTAISNGLARPLATLVRARVLPHHTATMPRPRTAGGGEARLVTRGVAMLVAALLVLPSAMDAHQAEAGTKNTGKWKTITRTFSSGAAIDIPDAGSEGPANPYPSSIEVDAFEKFKRAKIKDVDLTVRGLGHTRPEDVELFLVAPDGRNALLMSDRGGGADADDVTLTFDDEADDPVPDSGPIVNGAFQPANSGVGDEFPAPAPEPSGNEALSVFDGRTPDGKWRLFVVDDTDVSGGHSGEIADGWTLEITAKVKKEKKDKDK